MLGRQARTVAVSEQYAHVVAAVVRGGEIWLAIAIEVGHHYRVGLRAHAEAAGVLKSSVTVTPQQAHVVAELVGNDDVGMAIAEVRDRYGARPGASSEGAGSLKTSVLV